MTAGTLVTLPDGEVGEGTRAQRPLATCCSVATRRSGTVEVLPATRDLGRPERGTALQLTEPRPRRRSGLITACAGP